MSINNKVRLLTTVKGAKIANLFYTVPRDMMKIARTKPPLKFRVILPRAKSKSILYITVTKTSTRILIASLGFSTCSIISINAASFIFSFSLFLVLYPHNKAYPE